MRRPLKSMNNGLAFIITIVVGIGFGYLYTGADALYE